MSVTTPPVDVVLRETVARILGVPEPPLRRGQLDLAVDIYDAMTGWGDSAPGHVLGCAPTGVGKAFAGLVPSMLAAVRGERTVLSTESLALQAQIIDKDAPEVAETISRLTGYRPSVAVAKGWGNYVCALQAYTTTVEALVAAGRPEPPSPPAHQLAPQQVSEMFSGLAYQLDVTRSPARTRGPRFDPKVTLGGREYPRAESFDLLGWAVSQIADGEDGDRSRYTGAVPDGVWSTVSVAPSECAKTSCPFQLVCRPATARKIAADADIVVVNHSLLAVQAANQIPVVFGGKLGTIHHLVVDEAHGLPGKVRDQGAVEVSPVGVYRLARMVERTFGSAHGITHDVADALVRDGSDLADQLERALSAFLDRTDQRGAVKFDPQDNPLAELAPTLLSWAATSASLVPDGYESLPARDMLRMRRYLAKLETFVQQVTDAVNESPGMARWVDRPHGQVDGFVLGRGWSGASLHVSPVDVSFAIAANLFNAPFPVDGTDGEEFEVLPLSVTMMSATLPVGFGRQVGITEQVASYPSPFDDAYGASLFFAPKLTDLADVALVSSARGSRFSLDTRVHPQWAKDQIARLVVANGGSALVLSATVEAGKLYVNTLRRVIADAGLDLAVHSQWDGRDARQTVADWRDDHASVLVGTRSMMTGVDAPGQTCSLVIIDRAPRAAGNVVDDARVEQIMAAQQVSKWAADRLVYVADAALLLEQAAGRLVRSVTDSGLMVCLDPRLAKGSPLSYPEETRQMYMAALRRFPHKTVSLAAALDFVTTRRVAA